MSRDLTFDESSVIDVPVSIGESNDIVDQGGEVAKVDDNIISTPKQDEEPTDRDPHIETNNTYNNPNEEEFQDAQEDPPPQLRRSSRIRRRPDYYWKSTNLVAHALSAQTVPISYKKAITPEKY